MSRLASSVKWADCCLKTRELIRAGGEAFVKNPKDRQHSSYRRKNCLYSFSTDVRVNLCCEETEEERGEFTVGAGWSSRVLRNAREMQSYPAKRPKQLNLTLKRQVHAAVTVTEGLAHFLFMLGASTPYSLKIINDHGLELFGFHTCSTSNLTDIFWNPKLRQ